MAWFSKVRDDVRSHNQKVWALSRVNIHIGTNDATVDQCGIYRRDPRKHEGEPNLLPEIIEEARRQELGRQIRRVMGRRSR